MIAPADSAPVGQPAPCSRALDGSSVVHAGGQGARESGREISQLQVLGLDVHDLYALIGRDTLGVAGQVGLSLQVGGTALAPTFRGTGSMDEGPLRRLPRAVRPGRAQLSGPPARRQSRPLAHRGEHPHRRGAPAHGPGPARRGAAAAGRPAHRASLRRQRRPGAARGAHAGGEPGGRPAGRGREGRRHLGQAAARGLRVGAEWQHERPRPGRAVGSVDGDALLQGDSVVLRAYGSPAAAATSRSAAIRLENLSRPVLALDFRAHQFRAVDVRNFLTLVGTGDLQLRGPVFGARSPETCRPTAARSTSPTW